MEETFLLMLLSYALTPTLSPKGRGHLQTRSWHTGWPDAYRNRLNQRREDSGFKADPVAANHGE